MVVWPEASSFDKAFSISSALLGEKLVEI